jgi:ribosomal subunit interface protein
VVRVQITERHCDVPADVLERTRDQIESLAKYEQRATSAEVVYVEEKHARKVEVIIHVDGAEAVVAHGDGTEFRSALDQVVDRLRRMLRRQRKRRRDHQAPPLDEGIGGE